MVVAASVLFTKKAIGSRDDQTAATPLELRIILRFTQGSSRVATLAFEP